MRTITYFIDTDRDPDGEIYWIIVKRETLHVTTGDEQALSVIYSTPDEADARETLAGIRGVADFVMY